MRAQRAAAVGLRCWLQLLLAAAVLFGAVADDLRILVPKLRVVVRPTSTASGNNGTTPGNPIGAGEPFTVSVEVLSEHVFGQPVRDATYGLETLVGVRVVSIDGVAASAAITKRLGLDSDGALEPTARFSQGLANFTRLALAEPGRFVLGFRLKDGAADEAQTEPFTVAVGPPIALGIGGADAHIFAGDAVPLTVGMYDAGKNGAGLDCGSTVPTMSLQVRIARFENRTEALLTTKIVGRDEGGSHDVVFTQSLALRRKSPEPVLLNPSGTPVWAMLRLNTTGFYLFEASLAPGTVAACGAAAANISRALAVREVIVGLPAGLQILSQPGNGRVGQPLAGVTRVAVVDGGGNLMSMDNSSWVSVRMASEGNVYLKTALGPTFLYRDWPLTALTASVEAGSTFLTVTSTSPLALLSPSQMISPGDLLEIRAVPVERISGLASQAATTGVKVARPCSPTLDGGCWRVKVKMVEGGASPLSSSPSTVMRLQLPWEGPRLTAAAVTLVSPGLVRPVINGVATFEDLRISVPFAAHRLVFRLHSPVEAQALVNFSVNPLVGAGNDGLSMRRLNDPRSAGSGPAAARSTSNSPYLSGVTSSGTAFDRAISGSYLIDQPRIELFTRAFPNISVISDPFRVAIGIPSQLVLTRPAGPSWAGNVPLLWQPVVAIADSEGNIVRSRNDDYISVKLLSRYNNSGMAADVSPQWLKGSTRARVQAGVAEFFDLKVLRPSPSLTDGGSSLSLVFSCHLQGFGYVSVEQRDLRVAYSAEWSMSAFEDFASVPASASSSSASSTDGDNGNNFDVRDAPARELDSASSASAFTTGGPQPGMRFGHSVSLSGNTAVSGAPYESSPKPEVMLIHAQAQAEEFEKEVQSVTIGAEWRPEVQRITISNATMEALCGVNNASIPTSSKRLRLVGDYALSWGGRTSRWIPVDSAADYVQAVLESDVFLSTGGEYNENNNYRGLPGAVIIGQFDRADAEVDPLLPPAKNGSYVDVFDEDLDSAISFTPRWRVDFTATFINMYGRIQPITIDTSRLNLTACDGTYGVNGTDGAGVYPSTAKLQEATVIEGSFRLSLPGSSSIFTEQVAKSYSNGSLTLGEREQQLQQILAAQKVSRYLAYNATVQEIGDAVLRDLGLENVEILDRTNDYYPVDAVFGLNMHTRVLHFYFPTYPYAYDVPTLVPDASMLKGYGSYVFVSTVTPGKAPLHGSFRLKISSKPASASAFSESEGGGAAMSDLERRLQRYTQSNAVITPPIAVNATGAELARAIASVASPSLMTRITATRLSRAKDVLTASHAKEVHSTHAAWFVTFYPVLNPVDLAQLSTEELRSAAASDEQLLSTSSAPAAGSLLPGAVDINWQDPTALTGAAAQEYSQLPGWAVLQGTQATVRVLRQPWVNSRDLLIYSSLPLRPASAGTLAGSVYVFKRGEAGDVLSWESFQRLVPATGQADAGADEYDLFGYSTSISLPEGGPSYAVARSNAESIAANSDSYDSSLSAIDTRYYSGTPGLLAIGAPGTRNRGHNEIQAITCVASGGFFRLGFRGAWSQPIPATTTTAKDLAYLLESIPTITRVSTTSATLRWDAPICSPGPDGNSTTTTTPEALFSVGSSTFITFLSPEDGNLPALQVDTSGLIGFNASVWVHDDVLPGTAKSSGGGTNTGDDQDNESSTGANAGAVYVFETVDTTLFGVPPERAAWRQTATLFGSVKQTGQYFGWSVSASSLSNGGNTATIAVGAPYARTINYRALNSSYNSADGTVLPTMPSGASDKDFRDNGLFDNGGVATGAVYIYTRPLAVASVIGSGMLLPWSEIEPQVIRPPADGLTALLGDGDDDPVAATAQRNRSPGATWSGDGHANDGFLKFGWSVALSMEGDTVAIGAPGARGGRGLVFVYKRQHQPNTALFFLDQILYPFAGGNGGASFSLSALSLSAMAAAAVQQQDQGVGSKAKSAASQDPASPYAFNALITRLKDAPKSAGFGSSLSFSYTALAVGSPSDTSDSRIYSNSGEKSGAVYLFERAGWGVNGGYLQLVQKVTPEPAGGGDRVGTSVAVTENVLAVGALPASLEQSITTANGPWQPASVTSSLGSNSAANGGQGAGMVSARAQAMESFALPQGRRRHTVQVLTLLHGAPGYVQDQFRENATSSTSSIASICPQETATHLRLGGAFRLSWRRRLITTIHPHTAAESPALTAAAALGMVNNNNNGASDGRAPIWAAPVTISATAPSSSDTAASLGQQSYSHVTTRRLPWNASPSLLKKALERDLGTGSVRITRIPLTRKVKVMVPSVANDGAFIETSRVDEAGYQWRVTFLNSGEDSDSGNGGTSNSLYSTPFHVDGGELRAIWSCGGRYTDDPTVVALDNDDVRGMAEILGAGMSPSTSSPSLFPIDGMEGTPAASPSSTVNVYPVTLGSGVNGTRIVAPGAFLALGAYRDGSIFSHVAVVPGAQRPTRGRVYVYTRDADSKLDPTLRPALKTDITSLLAAGGFNASTSAGSLINVTVAVGVRWTPQAVLSPHLTEPSDSYGYSIALSHDSSTALISAPTRAGDASSSLTMASAPEAFTAAAMHSDADGRTAGAAFTVDLSLLNIRTQRRTTPSDVSSVITVKEGDGITLPAYGYKNLPKTPRLTAVAQVPFVGCPPNCTIQPTRSYLSADRYALSDTAGSHGQGWVRIPQLFHVAYAVSADGDDWGAAARRTPPDGKGGYNPIRAQKIDGQENGKQSVPTGGSAPVPAGYVARRAQASPAGGLSSFPVLSASTASSSASSVAGFHIVAGHDSPLLQAPSINDGADDGAPPLTPVDRESSALLSSSSYQQLLTCLNGGAQGYSPESALRAMMLSLPFTHGDDLPLNISAIVGSDMADCNFVELLLDAQKGNGAVSAGSRLDMTASLDYLSIDAMPVMISQPLLLPNGTYLYQAVSSNGTLLSATNRDALAPLRFSVRVPIVQDGVLETPDEYLHVRLFLPGFYPLFGGDLWSTIRIKDDGDGRYAQQETTVHQVSSDSLVQALTTTTIGQNLPSLTMNSTFARPMGVVEQSIRDRRPVGYTPDKEAFLGGAVPEPTASSDEQKSVISDVYSALLERISRDMALGSAVAIAGDLAFIGAPSTPFVDAEKVAAAAGGSGAFYSSTLASDGIPEDAVMNGVGAVLVLHLGARRGATFADNPAASTLDHSQWMVIQAAQPGTLRSLDTNGQTIPLPLAPSATTKVQDARFGESIAAMPIAATTTIPFTSRAGVRNKNGGKGYLNDGAFGSVLVAVGSPGVPSVTILRCNGSTAASLVQGYGSDSSRFYSQSSDSSWPPSGFSAAFFKGGNVTSPCGVEQEITIGATEFSSMSAARRKELFPIEPDFYRVPTPFQDGFGAHGSLALAPDGGSGAYLAIGCPGHESVYLYRKLRLGYNTASASIPSSQWRLSLVLRANTFAVTSLSNGMPVFIQGGFGASVAFTSAGTLAIGAPTAGEAYTSPNGLANLPALVEGWLAEEKDTHSATYNSSIHNVKQISLPDMAQIASDRGTGAVYMYQWVAGVTTDDQLSQIPDSGGRISSERSQTVWARTVGWPYGDAVAQVKLKQLLSAASNNATSLFVDPAAGQSSTFDLLLPDLSDEMKRSGIYDEATVAGAGGDGMWVQQAVLIPEDARPNDGFGSVLSIDGSTLAVGSPLSSPVLETTWDFEEGDLRGWSVEGDAFAYQPTFGDNSAARSTAYPDRRLNSDRKTDPANPSGRFYIGSYEHRPVKVKQVDEDANGKLTSIPTVPSTTSVLGHNGGISTGRWARYTPANVTTVFNNGTQVDFTSDFPAGAYQGDAPTGVMTSQPFHIGGSLISFLIGGGCDINTIQVALLIDGLPVLKATGKCSEAMTRVYWPVGLYRGRTGVIRIYDGSSLSPWGHISVDDFRFSWDIKRGAYGSGSGGGSDDNAAIRASGSVHVFTRVLPIPFQDASGGFNQPTNSNPDLPSSILNRYAYPPYSGFRSPHNAISRLWASTCGDNIRQPLSCVWQHSARLQSSSARPGLLFGSSVAVSEEAGIILASATGNTELLTAAAAAASRAGPTDGTGGSPSLSPVLRNKWAQRALAKFASLPSAPSSAWPDAPATNTLQALLSISSSSLTGTTAGFESGLQQLLLGSNPFASPINSGAGASLANAAGLSLAAAGTGNIAPSLLWSTLFPQMAPSSLIEGSGTGSSSSIGDLAFATVAPGQHPSSRMFADHVGGGANTASLLPSGGAGMRPRLSGLATALLHPEETTEQILQQIAIRARDNTSLPDDAIRLERLISGQASGMAYRPRSPPASGYLYLFRATPELRSGDRTWYAQPREQKAFLSTADGTEGAPANADAYIAANGPASRLSLDVSTEHTGQLVRTRMWHGTEHAVIDIPSLSSQRKEVQSNAHAVAASKVALSGMLALIGTPRDARLGENSGGGVVLDLSSSWLGFVTRLPSSTSVSGSMAASSGDPTNPSAPLRANVATSGAGPYQPDPNDPAFKSNYSDSVYIVSEGTPAGRVTIPVYRFSALNYPNDGSGAAGVTRTNLPSLSRLFSANEKKVVTVGYSTFDITATGISSRKAEKCWWIAPELRRKEGCGDYVRSTGVLTFYPETQRADIVIDIIDDRCFSSAASAKTFGIKLFVPGGATLRGESYAITVRIDDDDLPAAGPATPAVPILRSTLTAEEKRDKKEHQVLDGNNAHTPRHRGHYDEEDKLEVLAELARRKSAGLGSDGAYYSNDPRLSPYCY